MSDIRLIHFADIHLGFTGPTNLILTKPENEEAAGHLEEFKKHFFEANTGEVMKRTTELLMHAITDQSILGVKFDRDEFQYLDASYSPRPSSRLSGGEKALVGLCLRIALAEQAQIITKTGRVKFLVLDVEFFLDNLGKFL